jgi:ferritin-like metal-binding protein YciE
MAEIKNENALDAGIIASTQAVEHYEITRYGTLFVWAKRLGMNEAAELLEQTLKEEKHADELLTKIAEGSANQKAAA